MSWINGRQAEGRDVSGQDRRRLAMARAGTISGASWINHAGVTYGSNRRVGSLSDQFREPGLITAIHNNNIIHVYNYGDGRGGEEKVTSR